MFTKYFCLGTLNIFQFLHRLIGAKYYFLHFEDQELERGDLAAHLASSACRHPKQWGDPRPFSRGLRNQSPGTSPQVLPGIPGNVYRLL